MKKNRSFLISLAVCSALCLFLILASLALTDEPSSQEPAFSGPTRQLTAEQFEALLQEQPLVVTAAGYEVQDPTYKALYPDMLRAVVQNNTQQELTAISVAFAAWDGDGQPVEIDGKRDLNLPSYLREVNYVEISIAPGGAFGQDYGYPVEEGLGIATVKAVAVSYETSGGDAWLNPYASQWAALYGGVPLASGMTVEVPLEEE